MNWLTEYQQKNLAGYVMPTRKDERWKYCPSLDDVIRHPAACPREPVSFQGGMKIIFCNLAEALQKHTNLIKPLIQKEFDAKYPLARLNAAYINEGLFIYIPDNCTASLNLTASTEPYVRNIIYLGKNSAATIITEQSNNQNFTNQVTTITLDENAKLNLYKLQKQNNLLSHVFVTQKKNSNLEVANFAVENNFSREELVVSLEGAGASCHTAGFYTTVSDNEYVDNHVEIDHRAPHSTSAMLYKGILAKKSRAVFNGRLHVVKDAQKIVAHQANHNLLLSADAEVYSKPELEIYADDVKCKHGATTGQMDDDALFYLRSRGIEHKEAQKILLTGFADEIMQRVTQPEAHQYIQEWLAC